MHVGTHGMLLTCALPSHSQHAVLMGFFLLCRAGLPPTTSQLPTCVLLLMLWQQQQQLAAMQTGQTGSNCSACCK